MPSPSIKGALESRINEKYEEVIDGNEVSRRVLEKYEQCGSIIDAIVYVFEEMDISLSSANEYLTDYIKSILLKEASDLSMLKPDHRIDDTLEHELFG